MPSLLRRPLLRPIRNRPRPAAPTSTSPLPLPVAARVRLSADLLASLLDVECRDRASLDDIEWADAMAARMLRRQAARGRASALS